MKKVSLFVIVLTCLFSCSHNSSKSNLDRKIASYDEPISMSKQEIASEKMDQKSTLKEIITNNHFGNGNATYYMTWNQFIETNSDIKYSYGKLNSECKTVMQVFTYCTSGDNKSTVTKTVINSQVDVKVKKEELIKIVNEAISISAQSSSMYYILGTNNQVTVIDTNLPLQANPVAVQNSENSIERLVYVNDMGRDAKETEANQPAKESSFHVNTGFSK